MANTPYYSKFETDALIDGAVVATPSVMNTETYAGDINLSKLNGTNYGTVNVTTNNIVTFSQETDGGFAEVIMVGDGTHEPDLSNFIQYDTASLFNKTALNENGIAFFRLFGKSFYNIIYNGITSVITYVKKSLYITTVNNNVQINNTNYPFTTATPFTIRFKIKSTSGSPYSSPFALANSTLNMVEVLYSNDYLGCYLSFGGSAYGLNKIYGQSTGVLTLNVWQDVCITYDGAFSANSTKVYIDNVSAETIVAADNYDSSPTGIDRVIIGHAYRDNAQTQNMKLLDLVVIDKVLTTTERNEAYNAGVSYDFSTATFLSNIISWHKFDSDLLDSKGTNNGTATTPNYSTDIPV